MRVRPHACKLNKEAELDLPPWDQQGSLRVPSEHPHMPHPEVWCPHQELSGGSQGAQLSRGWGRVKAVAVKQSSESLLKVW